MPTLDWLNRDAAFKTLDAVPYRLLELVSEHMAQNSFELQDSLPNEDEDLSNKNTISKNSKNKLQAQLNWAKSDKAEADDPPKPTDGNLLIQGDNLEALKALLPFYRGQVKCIFIDPPYNTKSAFEHYDDNLEHAQWLSMMLPRLQLLRELLREDGSIWVTIDDNEGHYLKVLMDEVFGRGNFLTTFIWQKSYGGGAKARYFVGLHEYIHCYAKNMQQLPDFFWPPDAGVLKYYKQQDSKFSTRGPYRLQPLATTSNDERPNLRYALPAPNGSEIWPAKQWQWSKERALEAIQNDELVFTKTARGYSVNYKQYLRDSTGEERRAKPKSIIDGQYTQHGTYESIELFGLEEKFAFPKPEGVIERIFQAASESNDLVLDIFLGSGTTAAVAQKMNRRWIGIEMGEHAKTHCLPRLQKVIDGEQGGISKSVNWHGGGSFRFMKLGATIFDETGAINPEVRFATLAAFIWMQETGAPWRGFAPPPSRGRLGGGWFSGAGARGENHPHPNPPLEGEGAKSAPLEGEGAESAPLEGEGAVHAATPFLGTHNGVDYFLLFNGILGDKRPNAGNVLTRAVLNELTMRYPNDSRPRVIYGESNRLGEERLKEALVQFKTLPHEVVKR